jgi:hypothetical protein
MSSCPGLIALDKHQAHLTPHFSADMLKGLPKLTKSFCDKVLERLGRKTKVERREGYCLRMTDWRGSR